MLFNTVRFFIFFLIIYGLYLFLDRKRQNILLLLASYVFYCFWDWRFLSLILLSTAFNYILGLKIEEGGTPEKKRKFLVLSVCLNLAMLGFFKYFNFFIGNMEAFLGLFGFNPGPVFFNIVLPLGISFYTFQAMSYPIDIYRGVIKPTRNPLDFALFVAFFPQLVAGPIERARNLLPQFENDRVLTLDRFYKGCWLVFWGLFKKIVIADNIAKFTDVAFGGGIGFYTGGAALIATLLYSIQIYADFSGYSNMARGFAKMMGIDLMVNFRAPFFSHNLYDFWQRWHISLTTWIKEYVYYPIALGKYWGKRLAAPVVVVVTWAIMGFWHGAAWKFIVWGIYHGILLVIYSRIRPYLKAFIPGGKIATGILDVAKMIFVFLLFSVGILFFAMGSTVAVAGVLKGIATDIFTWNWVTLGQTGIVTLIGLLIPLLAMEYFQYSTGDEEIIFKCPVIVRGLIYFLILFLIITYGDFGGKEYYYFQF